MITLITAVPGSGKTLYAVGLIVDFLAKGRIVYHNIAGLDPSKFPDNPKYPIENYLFDAPDDWRETPDGSVVIYDECQQPHLFPSNAKRGPVEDVRLTDMERHRHSGHHLIFITQAPTFVHHHIRKLVNEHVHFYRGAGSKVVSKYVWSHSCDSPNDRREQERADFTFFKFNKKHFPLYKSATIHNHKFKMPKKIIMIFIFIFIIFGLVVYLSANSSFLPWSSNSPLNKSGSAKAAATQAHAVALPPSSSSFSSAPSLSTVSGCVDSTYAGCRCWSSDFTPIDVPNTQCKAIMLKPLPRSITF